MNFSPGKTLVVFPVHGICLIPRYSKATLLDENLWNHPVFSHDLIWWNIIFCPYLWIAEAICELFHFISDKWNLGSKTKQICQVLGLLTFFRRIVERDLDFEKKASWKLLIGMVRFTWRTLRKMKGFNLHKQTKIYYYEEKIIHRSGNKFYLTPSHFIASDGSFHCIWWYFMHFCNCHLSNQKNPGCLGCIGDEILPNYMGILIKPI